MKYATVIEKAYSTPWLILPSKAAEIRSFLESKAADLEVEFEATEKPKGIRVFGETAIIPMQGVIFPKANLMMNISGGTSAEIFRSQVRAAARDQKVKSILLDVDTPGGSVLGIEEAAQAVREARDFKPVLASVNNGIMASAGYWIGSQASRIMAGPSTAVGSIGVILIHREFSEMDKRSGVKATVMTSSKRKGIGNPYEPLSKDDQKFLEGELAKIHDRFVSAVAQGRGVSEEIVRRDFGQGAMVQADDALKVGMIDAIQDFDSTLHGVEQTNITAARVGRIGTKRDFEGFLRDSGFSRERAVWLAGAWDDHQRESGELDTELKALIEERFREGLARLRA